MPDETKRTHDRRRYSRDLVGTDVKMSNGLRNLPGRVRDISAGGAAVEWLDILERPEDASPVGIHLQLHFHVGLALHAHVASIEGNTVHVTFEIDDIELAETLKDLRQATGACLAA